MKQQPVMENTRAALQQIPCYICTRMFCGSSMFIGRFVYLYPPGCTETQAMECTRRLRSPAELQCCAADAGFDPLRFSWQIHTRLRILRPAPPPLWKSGTQASPDTCSRLSGRGLPAVSSLECRCRCQGSTNVHLQGHDVRESSLVLSECVTRGVESEVSKKAWY